MVHCSCESIFSKLTHSLRAFDVSKQGLFRENQQIKIYLFFQILDSVIVCESPHPNSPLIDPQLNACCGLCDISSK